MTDRGCCHCADPGAAAVAIREITRVSMARARVEGRPVVVRGRADPGRLRRRDERRHGELWRHRLWYICNARRRLGKMHHYAACFPQSISPCGKVPIFAATFCSSAIVCRGARGGRVQKCHRLWAFIACPERFVDSVVTHGGDTCYAAREIRGPRGDVSCPHKPCISTAGGLLKGLNMRATVRRKCPSAWGFHLSAILTCPRRRFRYEGCFCNRADEAVVFGFRAPLQQSGRVTKRP